MFERSKAEKIACEYLSWANPGNWDGNGKAPDDFKPQICTYDIQSVNNNELDISCEYDEETGCWEHYCELRDKDSGDLMIPLHGYGINSVNNLADTIMDVCCDEN